MSRALVKLLRHGAVHDGRRELRFVREVQRYMTEGWMQVKDALWFLRKNPDFVQVSEQSALSLESGAVPSERLSFTTCGGTRYIRAEQGHSLPLELQEAYEKYTDRHQLWVEHAYHGTMESAVAGILASGLQAMGRQFVHISRTLLAAADSAGIRMGSEVAVVVDMRKLLYEEGREVGINSKNTLLVDHVPVTCLWQVMRLADGKLYWKADGGAAGPAAQALGELLDDRDLRRGPRQRPRTVSLKFDEPQEDARPEKQHDEAAAPPTISAALGSERTMAAAFAEVPAKPGSTYQAATEKPDWAAMIGNLQGFRTQPRARGNGPTRLPEEVDFLFEHGFYMRGVKLNNGNSRDCYGLVAAAADSEAAPGRPKSLVEGDSCYWVLKLECRKEVKGAKQMTNSEQEAALTRKYYGYGAFPFEPAYLVGEVKMSSGATVVAVLMRKGRPLDVLYREVTHRCKQAAEGPLPGGLVSRRDGVEVLGLPSGQLCAVR